MEAGRLEMGEDGSPAEACEASDEVLVAVFEQYIYGELDVGRMQRDREGEI